ncbi:MAG: cupin domain-containing protein [Acidimicrobiales bacterium]
MREHLVAPLSASSVRTKHPDQIWSEIPWPYVADSSTPVFDSTPLEGVIGAEVDGRVVRAEPGDSVLVPRDADHTFWNETDSRADVLELFTPAGLERWFGELAEIVAAGSFDLDTIVESGRRFGTELDLESIQPLVDRHHLVFPG